MEASGYLEIEAWSESRPLTFVARVVGPPIAVGTALLHEHGGTAGRVTRRIAPGLVRLRLDKTPNGARAVRARLLAGEEAIWSDDRGRLHLRRQPLANEFAAAHAPGLAALLHPSSKLPGCVVAAGASAPDLSPASSRAAAGASRYPSASRDNRSD
jgi:hypothetical protein